MYAYSVHSTTDMMIYYNQKYNEYTNTRTHNQHCLLITQFVYTCTVCYEHASFSLFVLSVALYTFY